MRFDAAHRRLASDVGSAIELANDFVALAVTAICSIQAVSAVAFVFNKLQEFSSLAQLNSFGRKGILCLKCSCAQ